jgi:hypothetical protein
MAAKQRHLTGVITLNGSAQQVSAALGLPAGSHVRDLSLQPDSANASAVAIGHDSTLTTANCGTLLPAASGGVPPPPYIRDGFEDGTASLDEFYVRGTNGEKVHVDVILNDYSVDQA